MNPITFDLERGRKLRDEGIRRASKAKDPHFLFEAKLIARQIAVDRGEVTSDDVAKEMQARGYPPLGRAAGSVFRTGDWEWTGKLKQTEQSQSHGAPIRVWKLR